MFAQTIPDGPLAQPDVTGLGESVQWDDDVLNLPLQQFNKWCGNRHLTESQKKEVKQARERLQGCKHQQKHWQRKQEQRRALALQVVELKQEVVELKQEVVQLKQREADQQEVVELKQEVVQLKQREADQQLLLLFWKRLAEETTADKTHRSSP